MTGTPRVLHVDDDPSVLTVSESTARATSAFDLVTAQTSSEAIEAVEGADVDAVITDSLTTSEGEPLARAIRRRAPDLPVLLFTASDRPAVDEDRITAYVQKGDGGFTEVFDRVRTLFEASAVEPSVAERAGRARSTAGAPADDTLTDGGWTTIGTHDWSESQELGTTIVQLLTSHLGEDLSERESLYRSVDPDSLEQLLGPRLDGSLRDEIQVRFTYEGHEVAVSSDGTVSARPRAEDVDWLDSTGSSVE